MNTLHAVIIFTSLGSFLFSVIPSISAGSEPNVPETVDASHATPANQLYSDFNVFNSAIRDGRIGKNAAHAKLRTKLARIREDYYRRGGRDFPATGWVFPVSGYTASAIDKGKNHGYVPSGYDFFSGNRHGGHPSYDIFIRDRNQDSRDDRSGTAVAVLSLTGGVVVALEKEWQQGSGLRGGKYIWIYDPGNDLLVYYAHNDELFVELGTIVTPGHQLATIGRSGLNAAKRRSPTHLHLSVLRVNNGTPMPIPIYRELQQTISVPP